MSASLISRVVLTGPLIEGSDGDIHEGIFWQQNFWGIFSPASLKERTPFGIKEGCTLSISGA